MRDLEGHRHAVERGTLLRTLMQEYAREMTAVRSLMLELDAINIPLSPEGIAVHLTYLAEQGYVRIWRARDLPGWRADRAMGDPREIRFAKLTARGMQLLDGDIAADPKVAF